MINYWNAKTYKSWAASLPNLDIQGYRAPDQTSWHCLKLLILISAILAAWLIELSSEVSKAYSDAMSATQVNFTRQIKAKSEVDWSNAVVMPISEGIASWYDYTLNGLNWSETHATCASRDFPRYSTLKVSYGEKSITCFINDFGPEEWTGRHLDLSSYAFNQLTDLKKGLIKIKISPL
jgi:rare lipoprotein A